MTLNRDLAGSGAMLVRLLGIGARSGLSAETTLLHVLDGVPLRQAAIVIPRLTPEALETLREAAASHIASGPVHVADGATHPAREVEHGYGTDTSVDEDADDGELPDGLNVDAIEGELGADCWSGPTWTPAKGSKADRALDLWSTTQIDVVEIATRLGSTPGAIRSIVKKARARGEPRAHRPVADLPAETQAAIQEAKALPLKRDRAILLWHRTDLRTRDIAEVTGSTPAAVSLTMKVARREGHPDVLAGDVRRGFKSSHRADEPAGAGGAPEETAAPATTGGHHEPDLTSGLAAQATAGEPVQPGDDPAVLVTHESENSPDRAEEECAEPVDEPSTHRPDVGAFPAPLPAHDPEEKGTVRPEPPLGDRAPDTADRPAGPGLSSAPADQAIDAMVAGLAKKAAPDPRLETLLGLYGSTTRQQKEIGAELGLSEWKVSTLIKAARGANDSRVVAGDAARAAMKAAEASAAPVKVAPPDPPPPPAPAAQPTAAPNAAPAPKPSDLPPGDLVDLKQDQVLAVDRGWIVGPAGSVKGFPLIAGVLAALGSGDLLPAKLVAQRSGARSGEAVLQMLQFWRDDLGRIGVEVVRVGATDVRLRRKEA